MNVNVNENYFEETNDLIIKTTKFIEELTQTDVEPLPICQEQNTQTDELKEINEIEEFKSKIDELNEDIKKLTEKNTKLSLQITRMNYDNGKLKENYNELMQLVMLISKLDIDNPDIDTIRNKLTILVNREIRLKYAFPFTTIFSKILK